MMKKYLIILTIIILAGFKAHAANNDFEIVAVVGDDAISAMDVKERVELAIASSGLQSTKDIKEKLFSQIIRVLIDESIYKQEAAKLNVSVSEQEIKTAMMKLEQRNGIKAGTFREFLKEKNIPADAAIEQLEAQLLWNKIVARKVRPNIYVTDFEIEEKLEHISNSSGTSELNVSEIELPIDEAKNEKQVRLLAKDLVEELREGADFTSVAKEFSRGSSSTSGGELGWVEGGDLPEETLLKLRNLRVGGISDPFKVDSSYKIVKLNDRRAIVAAGSIDDKVGIKQAFVTADTSNQAKIQKLSAKFRKHSKNVNSCGDFSSFAKKVGSELESGIIQTKLKDLNGEVQSAINKTKVGAMTDVIKGPTGLYMFMVCERPKPKTSIVLENRVKEMLLRRKIELQSQHYLRSLRQNIFIEIRA